MPIELKNDCFICEHAFKPDVVDSRMQHSTFACEYGRTSFPKAIACTTFDEKKPKHEELYLDC